MKGITLQIIGNNTFSSVPQLGIPQGIPFPHRDSFFLAKKGILFFQIPFSALLYQKGIPLHRFLCRKWYYAVYTQKMVLCFNNCIEEKGTVVEQLGSELKTYWVDNNNLALSPFLQLHPLSHFFIAIIFFEPNKPHILT